MSICRLLSESVRQLTWTSAADPAQMVQNPQFQEVVGDLCLSNDSLVGEDAAWHWYKKIKVKAKFHEPTDQKFEHPRIRGWFDRHRPPQGCITLFIFTGNRPIIMLVAFLSIVYCGWLYGGFVIDIHWLYKYISRFVLVHCFVLFDEGIYFNIK